MSSSRSPFEASSHCSCTFQIEHVDHSVQISNNALSVQEFAGMWYLLLGVVAFGFLWALGERFLVYLMRKFPHLRGQIKRAIGALAVHGKRFNLSQRFSMQSRAHLEQPSLDIRASKDGESSLEVQGHDTSGASRSFGSRSPIGRAIRKVDEESAIAAEARSNANYGGSEAAAADLVYRC